MKSIQQKFMKMALSMGVGLTTGCLGWSIRTQSDGPAAWDPAWSSRCSPFSPCDRSVEGQLSRKESLHKEARATSNKWYSGVWHSRLSLARPPTEWTSSDLMEKRSQTLFSFIQAHWRLRLQRRNLVRCWYCPGIVATRYIFASTPRQQVPFIIQDAGLPSLWS